LIDDDRSDNDRLPAVVAGLWLITTLEIVVRDDFGQYLLLDHPRYASGRLETDDTDEGYWAPPAFSYLVHSRYSTPYSVGTVRRLFKEKEEELGLDKRDEGMEQLAWLLGVRDPVISYLGSFIEVKNSRNTPEQVKCYKIRRYSLRIGEEPGLRDLADPECHGGHVFLPLDDSDLHEVLHPRFSRRHERVEKWFLGKPLVTNVQYIVESPERRASLRERAIKLRREHFRREEEGLLCVGDLAGYGAASQYAREQMHGFGVQGTEMERLLQFSVIRRFDEMFSSLGASQVQIAGDGFTAAFPTRVFARIDEAVTSLLTRWLDFLDELEFLNKDIRDPNIVIGSRMALHYGTYQYGRIGLARSSRPAFDGGSVVEVVRLEQGLALALRGVVQDSAPSPDIPTLLVGQRHTLAVSDTAYDFCAGQLAGFEERLIDGGRFQLVAKELRRHAHLFGFSLGPPRGSP
jgi:hypothetical protein